MAARPVGPTLRVFYRCDKIVKEHLEGEVLWTGPSDKEVLLIEADPYVYLADPFLMEAMKKQVFSSLKQQPYVSAILREGDSLGAAPCDIYYDTLFGPAIFDVTIGLSGNFPHFTRNDDMGPYTQLWITMTLIVNSPDPNHSVSPLRARLNLGPGPGYYTFCDTGDLAAKLNNHV